MGQSYIILDILRLKTMHFYLIFDIQERKYRSGSELSRTLVYRYLCSLPKLLSQSAFQHAKDSCCKILVRLMIKTIFHSNGYLRPTPGTLQM